MRRCEVFIVLRNFNEKKVSKGEQTNQNCKSALHQSGVSQETFDKNESKLKVLCIRLVNCKNIRSNTFARVQSSADSYPKSLRSK